jgi:GTPase Era involved in 16S rRNA processing
MAVDAVLVVVEAHENAAGLSPAAKLPEAESWILERLAATGKPAVLCLNKVDKVKDKGQILPLIEWWGRAGKFSAVVPTCATRKKGLEGVVKELLRLLARRRAGLRAGRADRSHGAIPRGRAGARAAIFCA